MSAVCPQSCSCLFSPTRVFVCTCVRVHTYCAPWRWLASPQWGCFSWFSRTNICGGQTIVFIFFCKQFEIYLWCHDHIYNHCRYLYHVFLQAHCSDHPLTRDLMQVICQQTENSNNRIQFFCCVCFVEECLNKNQIQKNLVCNCITNHFIFCPLQILW